MACGTLSKGTSRDDLIWSPHVSGSGHTLYLQLGSGGQCLSCRVGGSRDNVDETPVAGPGTQ